MTCRRGETRTAQHVVDEGLAWGEDGRRRAPAPRPRGGPSPGAWRPRTGPTAGRWHRPMIRDRPRVAPSGDGASRPQGWSRSSRDRVGVRKLPAAAASSRWRAWAVVVAERWQTRPALSASSRPPERRSTTFRRRTSMPAPAAQRSRPSASGRAPRRISTTTTARGGSRTSPGRTVAGRLRVDPRPPRLLREPDRRSAYRRRTRSPAARRVLRRLGDRRDRRADER